MKDTKSSIDNSCNLLYYVVKLYIDQNFSEDDILKKKDLTTKMPVPEPQDVLSASNCSFNEINKELNSIDAQMNSIEERFKRVIESCKQNNENSDDNQNNDNQINKKLNKDDFHIEPFRSKMIYMLEYARRIHSEQMESLNDCQSVFIDTMNFFAYKPKASTIAEQQHEFFTIWCNFCSNFKELFRKIINAKIKEVVDNARQNASKLMNKNIKKISNNSNNNDNNEKKLSPFGLKARVKNKFFKK